MGWGIVGDIVGGVGDAAGAVGGAVADVGEAAFDYGQDLAGGAYGLGADAADFSWNAAIDTLDYAEDLSPDFPFVDLEFDDGQISGAVDVKGFGASMNIGQNGVEAAADGGYFGGAGVAITGAGYSASLEIGDVGLPAWVPAVDFGLSGDYDGNVDADLEAQGSFPLYGGLVVGEVKSEFHRTENGEFSVGGEISGDLYTTDRTNIGGRIGASYAQTAEGSMTTASAEGHISTPGYSAGANVDYVNVKEGDDEYSSLTAGAQFKGYGVEASGEVAYTELEVDGVAHTTFDADGQATGHGISASGSASYREISDDEGSRSSWETDYDVEVSPDALKAAAEYLSSELGVEIPEEVGDIHELIEQAGDAGIVETALQRVTSGGAGEIGDQIVGAAGQAANLADATGDDLKGLFGDEVAGIVAEVQGLASEGEDLFDEYAGTVESLVGEHAGAVQDAVTDAVGDHLTIVEQYADEQAAAAENFTGGRVGSAEEYLGERAAEAQDLVDDVVDEYATDAQNVSQEYAGDVQDDVMAQGQEIVNDAGSRLGEFEDDETDGLDDLFLED